MSEQRRIRRKKQREQQKGSITKRDKVYGILAIVFLFLITLVLVLIYAFS